MPAQTQKFGASKIETPALFASYRIGDRQQAGLRRYPWEMTDTQGILLNAFDLLANRRTHKVQRANPRRKNPASQEC